MYKFPDYVSDTEARIAHKLISAALKAGFKVSVHDGEEWPVKGSTSQNEIEAECFATDETTLRFRLTGEPATKVGDVLLILGNGEDVISDHTDNETIGQLVKLAS
jgi:hypothetical protein